MKRIAVIGAGLSGLLVARQLNTVASVTVFEKSRGPAGRLATRTASPFQFDHGAQYFTANTQAFKTFIKPLLSTGQVQQWDTNIVELDHSCGIVSNNCVENRPIYVAKPKMNQLGKHLASELDAIYSKRVLRMVRAHAQWQLLDDNNGSLGCFDWVISAIPSVQCAELMPAAFKFLPIVKQSKMSGCYALMLGFKEPLDLPWQAAKVTDSAISWICVNSSKPGRPPDYSLLVHSSNHWAERRIEDDQDSVRAQLMDELESILQIDIGHVDHTALHRWRYAKPDAQIAEEVLLDAENQLGACGDWCVKGTVEGAYTSGMRMAARMAEML